MIEAMKQALEALEMLLSLDTHDEMHLLETDIAPKAIVALKQAIEQVDKQEPVMWVYRYTREDGSTYLSHVLVDERNPVEAPLYTAPPKPEWMGLTDEELERIAFHHLTSVGDYWVNELAISERHIDEFAEAISAKLKEKNHG